MLNKFQLDLIVYLETTAGHFISTLTDETNGLIIIDDLVPKITDYLGAMVKRDLDLHEDHSEGHQRLTDMLIEIHLKPNQEFSSALVRAALQPVRRRPL